MCGNVTFPFCNNLMMTRQHDKSIKQRQPLVVPLGGALRSGSLMPSVQRVILIKTRLQMQVILENAAKFPLVSLSNDYKLAYFP